MATPTTAIYSGVLTPEQVSYLNDHPGRVAPEPSTSIRPGGELGLLAYALRKRR